MSDSGHHQLAEFPHVQAVFQQGIERRIHSCLQIYVSLDDQVRLNHAFGLAQNDRPASPQTVMLWRSAGKPLTASGILRLQEAGQLSLDDTLRMHIPDAHGTVFADMRLTDLLCHATRLPVVTTNWPQAEWDATIAAILATNSAIDAEKVAYQPQATWFLLGEILRLRRGADSFNDALQQLVIQPANLGDCWCGLPDSVVQQHADHLPELLERQNGQLVRSSLSDAPALTRPSPGGNLRGPVSTLGNFYEMLSRGGVAANGSRFLAESSVRRMTSRHRQGRFDFGLQHKVDMGLGLIVNSEQYGPAVPYGYGRCSSSLAWGHGGAQCSMGFCDPRYRLVVAWAADGLCGEPQHQRRNRSLNEAIYEDLGLAS